MLPHDTLVVVTDGQSATLFRNAARNLTNSDLRAIEDALS